MTMRSDVSRLLLKVGLLAAPLGLLVVAYLWFDPFMVLRRHEQWYPGEIGVSPNRDYVSTELLRDPARPRPDSFIFGNSRSLAFETADWTAHLPTHARPFHYDASLETLYGIWGKVHFLDANGFAIRNALLVVDADLLSHADHSDKRALYRKHPLISGDSWWEFQLSFVEAFLSRLFFIKYLDYQLSHRWRGYMGGVLERRSTAHDPVTNDLSFRPREDEIARLGEEYYRRHAGEFDGRARGEGTPTVSVIGAAQRARLEEVAAIFARHGTQVRIVVSPLYDDRPLAVVDRTLLEGAFGKDRVFDYSGNNDITADRHNYYESSHYRVAVARRILETIYAPTHAP
ncbi:MAG: hypothetical protein ABJA82_00165 [Myxococcales bacterium]